MGPPSEPGFWRSSINNGSPSNPPDPSKSSKGGGGQGSFGGLISCFLPCGVKSAKEEDQDSSSRTTTPSNDVSCSFYGSKTSSVSSTSLSKLSRFSGSYGADDDGRGTRDFSIADISRATRNYSTENIIGQGGFGTVYKGKLKDGTLVAVKRAKKNLYQRLSSEFKSEIETLSKVEHLNLVRFLGYLEHDDERIVVVEHVGNGTLRQHLDGIHGEVLEIAARLDVAIDVAHAITYLHMYTDHPIIHRDIKSSNILLTEKLRAKVADFGFARLAAEDPDATHISTQVKGTAGYLDPEYLQTYQLTEKSDVYSFGVLLIELVSGRRPIERNRSSKERITAHWAMQRLKEGGGVLAMDPRLRRSPTSIMVVDRVLRLAKECVAASRKSRPSMKKCAEVLWGIRKDFREMQLSS
ncbi:uncharacterized protein A4U43_C07F420 [Asparagus officinalis]|uniref:non-specific serine/threonine protein kinase n=1 Tax=Asparagus officinalis TaxID=4686 RepID=A0A5P1E842_ASPOF|nr:calmodulin-binding receptor-like cytoplasmic kinase 2 [Asparagus officinalis]ONK62106.1 uncharacterized protein A4U43_C07F420 [Asparagus officinalis]